LNQFLYILLYVEFQFIKILYVVKKDACYLH